MKTVLRDIGFAWRLLGKHALHATITVLALALGIGLTATMFSVVHGIFLKALQFRDSRQIVQMDSTNLRAGIERMPLTFREYLACNSSQRSFERLAAWYGRSIIVSGSGMPAQHVNGAYVSSSLFPLLGVAPSIGRAFDASDDTNPSPSIVLISDKLWNERYRRAPDILGKTVRINGRDLAVAGVMGPGFEFPLNQDVWLPLELTAGAMDSRRLGLQAVGRLRDGVSLQAAQAEMTGIARQLRTAYPATDRGVGLVVRHYIDAYSDKEMRSYLSILFGAVLAVFLIACSTAASLMLSLASLRARELAIRQALGASRARIVRQLLSESLLLASLGGLLGVALTLVATSRIQAVVKPILRSFWIDVRPDLPVTAFLVAATLLASLLCGLAPALRVAGPDLLSTLKRPDGTGHFRLGWFRVGLVGFQVALSCALLVATGLLLQSTANLGRVDLGYDLHDLLVGSVSLPTSSYPKPESWPRFFDDLLTRLQAIPGAPSVALATSIAGAPGDESKIEIDGSGAAPAPSAQSTVVTPSYFSIFGLKLLRGRLFTYGDRGSSLPVAIVSQDLVRRAFPRGDPLGRRIRLLDGDAPGRWLTIVGIVSDLHANPLPQRQRGVLPIFDRPARGNSFAMLYLPLAQNSRRTLNVAIRGQGRAAIATAFRRVAAAVDPDIPTVEIQTIEASIADGTWDYRLFSALFAAFGAAALALAIVGLYGIVSLSVASRTREIGLRVALGATPAAALRLALLVGLRQLALGALAGLALSAVLARSLRGLLFEVAPWNPALSAAALLLLLVAGVAACLVPAWKALEIDPMEAMSAS